MEMYAKIRSWVENGYADNFIGDVNIRNMVQEKMLT